MTRGLKFATISLCSMGVWAQGPPPGRGHGGFGPRPEFGIMSAGPASRTPVTGAPYSAVETTQSQETLSDGNQITRQSQVKVYRDNDGRVRTERTFTARGSSTPQTEITIFDPVGGNFYSLNPQKNTATQHALPSASDASQRQPRAMHEQNSSRPQPVKENLGVQNINGLAATGTRTTMTIPAGAIGNANAIQIVREVWVSNDLKVPLMIKSSDPRFGTTVMQLTNVVQSAPDASLFVVPSNYSVTTMNGRGFGGARPMRRQGSQN